ncbi:MAG: polymerase, sigma 28 subunit, Sig subfamily [Pseudonocardia sp.]|nr:polymerase, sigma 28 subunit, Sig subfamily [Pseudonocardia sp.]
MSSDDTRSLMADEIDYSTLLSRPAPGVAVVTVVGEVDIQSTPQLRNALKAAVDGAPRFLIIDLSAVTFFSSAGVMELVAVAARAERDDVELSLVGIDTNRTVARVLSVCDVLTLFKVHRSASVALGKIDADIDATGDVAVEPETGAYSHLAPILAQFAALSVEDPQRRVLRDRLATAFLPVVRHIALRYQGRGEPTADLEQAGAVGLLGALERFDPGYGKDFLSFAVPTITGSIRRHFRDRTWSMRVPRRLKDLQGTIRDATEVLSETLGRAPRPSEIAAHLQTSVDEVIDALNAAHAHTPDSLDVLLTSAGRPLGDRLGQVDTALDSVDYRVALRSALQELPDREREILILRFFDDMTQTQIATAVGISQMHVSRLLSRSLATLHERIAVNDGHLGAPETA